MNSAIARRVLTIFFRPNRIYSIPYGALRGTKIWYDRSVNYHAVLGLWEPDTFRMLDTVVRYLKETRPRIVACDVGANIGLVTLWLARQLRNDGQVYSFEPSPSVLPLLEKNLAANPTSNVELVKAVCADKTGTMDFFIGFHHHSSSLDAEWARGTEDVAQRVTVAATTLDDFFLQAKRAAPDLIKIDIEGGGTAALPGAKKIFAEKRPLVLIESHTPQEDKAISDVLLTNDYQAFRLNNRQWVKEREETHPNLQGVWGMMLLCPSEIKDGLIKRFP